MKKTKILCTLGPASLKGDVLCRMTRAGMNAARINTAFDDLDGYRSAIEAVRAVKDIPLLIDLKGPEIRLNCPQGGLVRKGGTIEAGFRRSDGPFFNRDVYGQLAVKDVLLLDKGRVRARVVGKGAGRVTLSVGADITLKEAMGVNVPAKQLEIPTLSRKDVEAIGLARELACDFVALSFTRDARDVECLKRRLRGSEIGVIAKIENASGVENAMPILAACDGVMIARGDLGIEVPSERIPLIQKDLIARCNRMGKISIVATEMLHSMVANPQPTRAETSDVANAILDGADAVMLSAESAVGKYPVEAVAAMSRIALEVEPHMMLRPLDEDVHDKVSLAISKAVAAIIGTVDVDKIVVATHSGYTAMLISNFRIRKDIIAITDSPAVARKLQLVYAVQPVEHEYFRNKEKIVDIARYCLKAGLVSRRDLVLFIAGVYTKRPMTNLVELHRVSELMDFQTGV